MTKLLRYSFGVLALGAGCAKSTVSPSNPTPAPAPAAVATPAPAAASSGKTPYAVLDTSKGKIVVKLFPEAAPKTVENFIGLATGKKAWTDPKTGQQSNRPLYNGTIFHRVIPNFMVQGGGFTEGLKLKSGKAPIKNEAGNGLKNDRGTLAMARTMMVDSATSQFFINVVNNGFLNHTDNTSRGFGYAVFGKVIEGMDVVDKIAAVKTGTQKGFADVPETTVIIKSIKLVK